MRQNCGAHLHSTSRVGCDWDSFASDFRKGRKRTDQSVSVSTLNSELYCQQWMQYTSGIKASFPSFSRPLKRDEGDAAILLNDDDLDVRRYLPDSCRIFGFLSRQQSFLCKCISSGKLDVRVICVSAVNLQSRDNFFF